MMKIKITLLITAILIMAPCISDAQVGVLRRAMNRAIDRKIDSAIIKSEQEKAMERESGRQYYA